jgi:protein-S-isoprenylcysteine O-methyltransferase Ste14
MCEVISETLHYPLKGLYVDAVRKVNRIDVGRLIAVSIFTFFMTLNILLVSKAFRTLLPINMIKAVGLIYHLLVVCFYVLIILLYFLRGSATSTSRSFVTNAIALLTTFSPFALSLLSGPELSRPEIVLLADFIIVSGMILSIYSLGSLGRNFSIIPQARKLVQRGPYKLIRHPLYLGELVGLFGIVLAGLTILKMLAFFLIVGCQIYRAIREERLLSNVFMEYKEYCSKTARFIPGIF